MRHVLTSCGLAAGLILAAAAPALAGTVKVTITNNQTDTGVFLTPLFSVFHNGTLDLFDPGDRASTELEDLAETSNAAGLVANSAGDAPGVITSPGGFAGAPVIDPGETASLIITVDQLTQRFFSFASMVIPSNDLFIANEDPMAYEVFDASGKFTNLGPIVVTAGQVWDAGGEANDNLGAAFNAAGGMDTDENNGVSLIGANGVSALLDGQSTVAGTTVNGASILSNSIATITIAAVPVPASLPLLATGLIGFGLWRRRKQARA